MGGGDAAGLLEGKGGIIRRKLAHDARLVAVMQAHGLTDILTFNAADFDRFPGITVLNPAMI